jgi:hypothetical protein
VTGSVDDRGTSFGLATVVVVLISLSALDLAAADHLSTVASSRW